MIHDEILQISSSSIENHNIILWNTFDWSFEKRTVFLGPDWALSNTHCLIIFMKLIVFSERVGVLIAGAHLRQTKKIFRRWRYAEARLSFIGHRLPPSQY